MRGVPVGKNEDAQKLALKMDDNAIRDNNYERHTNQGQVNKRRCFLSNALHAEGNMHKVFNSGF